MKIMTYNIQNDYRLFNNNNIKNKAKDIVSLIKQYDLDIIGFQELSNRQVGLYKKLLNDYYFVGNHRHSGILSSEYNALFIKKDITIVSSKTYSLSDNIDKLGNKLNTHNYPRICTLSHIIHNNIKYLVVNTHLDNSSDKNREQELVILKSIIKKELNKEHLIVLGDFNMDNNIYLKDFSKSLKLVNCTYHLKNTFVNSKMVLDHIFISNTLKCDYKEKLLVEFSDHYPLIISMSNK